MNNQNNKYFNELSLIPHYQKHPQMMPFIGDKWGQKLKLLAIGESNYLSEWASVDIHENWYNLTKDQLPQDEIEFTSIHGMVAKDIEKRDFSHHPMFKNIHSVLDEVMILQPGVFSGIEYIAYMNFFLRPAYYGTGFKDEEITALDITTAYNNIQNVIDIITPDYIVFLSVLVRDILMKEYEKLEFNGINKGSAVCCGHYRAWRIEGEKYYIPHNWPYKKITGRESFKQFLLNNNIK